MLEFAGVTKRFGPVMAVDGLTARVEPGVVTGFLGPNGAGKTTSLRILLGLVGATSGTATIGGKRYRDLDHPLQTVGAALEASSFHPGRTAANHLTVYAQAAGIAPRRVDEVLGLVGLADVAGRKVGGYSLGMRQRLGLAGTLLGDPGVLVLDEPSNGLDPEGIKWIRGFLRELAAQGRTVLVSSHMLAEIQQQADALMIISRGRLVFQGPLYALTEPDEYSTVVDAPDRDALRAALSARGIEFEVLRSGLSVPGSDPADVGATAAAAGIALSTLQRRGPALEEVFLDLVNGTRVHSSAAGMAPVAPAAEVPAPSEVPASAPEPPGTPEDAATLPAANPDDPEVLENAAALEESPDDIPATWDADHTKTDSDVEADEFFSRFDAHAAAEAAADADAGAAASIPEGRATTDEPATDESEDQR
ncbi:ABC transporter ATP-binding protein [Microbacterium invictum]